MITTSEVFILRHIYKLLGLGEVKTIGLYTSNEKAKETLDNYKAYPGFKDHPRGFTIDQYELDVDHWVYGFSESEDLLEIIRRPVRFLKESGPIKQRKDKILSNKRLLSVYLLEHSYFVDDKEVVRIMGVYSTKSLAVQAKQLLKSLKGFRDHKEGFNVDKYQLDENNWAEGFITIKHL